MHIYALRLFPGIGHFVNSTFLMVTNLMQFSVIWGIVLVLFSVLFYFITDVPTCPLLKYDGFNSILESMFSTFKLTFGHGDFDAYYSNIPVKITYFLYVIIVALMLLNLIIASMSITAAKIMVDPWRELLWTMEWLDEATSVEYTFTVLALPFRTCCSICEFHTHRKAGFIVKKVENKHRVYVELFHCPALE